MVFDGIPPEESARLRAHYQREYDLYRSMDVPEEEIDNRLDRLFKAEKKLRGETRSDYPLTVPVILRNWEKLHVGTSSDGSDIAGSGQRLSSDGYRKDHGDAGLCTDASAAPKESRLRRLTRFMNLELNIAINPVHGCETLFWMLNGDDEQPELRATVIPSNPSIGSFVPVYCVHVTPYSADVTYSADLHVGEEVFPASVARELMGSAELWCPSLLVASGWMTAADVVPLHAELLRKHRVTEKDVAALRRRYKLDKRGEARIKQAREEVPKLMQPASPNVFAPDEDLVEVALRLLSPKAFMTQTLAFLEMWQLALETICQRENTCVYNATSTARLLGIMFRLRNGCRHGFQY